MNPCPTIDERLEEFREGLLDADQHREVESHLLDCAACRAAFGRVRAIEDVLVAARDRETAPPRWNVPMAAAALLLIAILGGFLLPAGRPELVRTAKSGAWSDPATWEGNAVPGEGARVQVRVGHAVTFDVVTAKPLRLVHVAGTLSFARDRDTRLDVALLKVHPGEHVTDDGFECEADLSILKNGGPMPVLELGTPNDPIPAKHTATIRLTYFEGMDKQTCPGLVACGGRMEFHGAPMSRTWTKLGAFAKKGDASVTLAEAVTGWRAGDRVIVTATSRDENEQGTRRPGSKGARSVFTEERKVASIEGAVVTLDSPLDHAHLGAGDFRGEVANLTRNVIVESADPAGVRGHTMYHRNSAGSVSYAEFRHLGKEGVLGKYSLHFHLAGNTMRGSSVVGASIWDSHNRWITIHGTNYLVVRDCVGYRSVGHGFFLEDGTEVYNLLDRNLAVQAYLGKRLPKQVLGFDPNDGAGFWWANSLNSFTRNVAVECDRYGFRFEATANSSFDPNLFVMGPDGDRKKTDIRTLPFVRFEGNEVHSGGLYGIRLGECVKQRAGPDAKHPFVFRDTKIWDQHYAFRPEVPMVLAEDTKLWKIVYGIYHPDFDHHVYRRLSIVEATAEPFNRGHDDDNMQHGPLAVDDLLIERSHGTLIQVSQYGSSTASSHFRNVRFVDNKAYQAAFIDITGNGQPKNPPPDDVIPYVLHDHFGPGRDAKILTEAMIARSADGLDYQPGASPLLGKRMRIAEAKDLPFPELLTPVDDLPPATVITSRKGNLVRGTTIDAGDVKRVLVNGVEARPTSPNFLTWEADVPSPGPIRAESEDASGNRETLAHELR